MDLYDSIMREYRIMTMPLGRLGKVYPIKPGDDPSIEEIVGAIERRVDN